MTECTACLFLHLQVLLEDEAVESADDALADLSVAVLAVQGDPRDLLHGRVEEQEADAGGAGASLELHEHVLGEPSALVVGVDTHALELGSVLEDRHKATDGYRRAVDLTDK